MTRSNEDILDKLDNALKEITVSDLGDSVLATQKFDQFVEQMEHRTSMLPEARFLPMESYKTEIDRVHFDGRVVSKAIDAKGNERGSESDEDPDFHTNTLNAVELRAKVTLSDRALRRNIERGGFEDTLVDLFGQACGRDFEELAVLADEDNESDDMLRVTDGWLEKAKHKLYGVNTDGDADFDKDDVEDVFDKMIEAMPKQYLYDPNEFRFYCPWSVADDYRDKLRDRETSLGDEATTTAMPLRYKGIPVVYAPVFERSPDADDGYVSGDTVLLANPDNMVWGIFHEVRIEQDRDPANRRTSWYMTFEGDCHYEDENATVVAFFDRDKDKV